MGLTVEVEGIGEGLRKIEAGISVLMNRQAMAAYGGVLRDGTRDRIKRERDVKGKPFVALSQTYAARKKGPGILRESGDLFDTLFVESRNAESEMGTRINYGTWHQTGLPEGDPSHSLLPQREWLGVTDADLEGVAKQADTLWEEAFSG